MSTKNKKDPFIFSKEVVLFPLLFIFLIWFVHWIQVRFGYRLSNFGVYPRTFKGLRGIICSPFLHGGLNHLWNNTMPLFVLSTAVFYFYRQHRWKVIVLGILFSGLLTWIIGRPSNHIGASGLIYVLVSFIFFKGIFTKYYRLVALSLIVVFLYGGMLWYVFPIEETISWEGHLSGLITGFGLAFLLPTQIQKEQYEWEKEEFNEEDDPFMKHFDAEGNFIEPEKELEEVPPIRFVYHYKNNEEE